MKYRIATCLFAFHISVFGCNSSSDYQTTPVNPSDPKDAVSAHNALPGRKGQPPPEVRTFVPPIKLIAAGEYWDGGTTWVHLQDNRGAQVIFCVTQDAFETDIAANSLFIGATNASETSARRPLSSQESALMIGSLESAVKLLLNEKLQNFIQLGSDPLEAQTHERITVPDENRFTQKEWNVIFAAHALDRIKSVKKHELADQTEITKRVAELEAVDLATAAADFRSRSGMTRHAEWERLQPVLMGELTENPPDDPSGFIIKLLGPNDIEAAERSGSMAGGPFVAPSADRILAYNLETDFSAKGSVSHSDLVVHLQEDGRVSFVVAMSVGPDKPTQEEKEREAKLARIAGAFSNTPVFVNGQPGYLVQLREEHLAPERLERLKLLPNVFQVSFEQARVTDGVVEQIATMRSLKELYLDGSEISDAALAHLRTLPNLWRLDLTGTKVTDAGLLNLRELPELEWLSLSNTRITDAGVLQLQHCPKLENLDLSGTAITDDGLKHLKKMPTLYWVYLNDTAITDAGLQHCSGLNNLARLHLDGTRITDAGLVHLQKLVGRTNPTDLSIKRTSITEKGIKTVTALWSGGYAPKIDWDRPDIDENE